jgi:hypothetical protein
MTDTPQKLFSVIQTVLRRFDEGRFDRLGRIENVDPCNQTKSMSSHEHEKDPLLTGQYDVYFEPTQNNSKVGTATAAAGDEETAASSSSAQQHQHRQFVPLLIPTNSLLSGASGSLSSPPRVVYKTTTNNYSSSHRRAHSTLEGGVTAPLATGGGEADSFAGTVSEAATIGSAVPLHLHDDGPDPPRSGDSGGKDGTGSRFFLYFVYAMVRAKCREQRESDKRRACLHLSHSFNYVRSFA